MRSRPVRSCGCAATSRTGSSTCRSAGDRSGPRAEPGGRTIVPMYQVRGEVPRKRHTQLWRDGRLLTEEVMGLRGFSGNETILYHLVTPSRIRDVAGFEPIEHAEWVPDAHVHRHLRTTAIEPWGDPVGGRRVLMWNHDVEVSLCEPADEMEAFYRNGEGDEVVFVHEGSGTLETILGDLPYRP